MLVTFSRNIFNKLQFSFCKRYMRISGFLELHWGHNTGKDNCGETRELHSDRNSSTLEGFLDEFVPFVDHGYFIILDEEFSVCLYSVVYGVELCVVLS